jgi:hypothetical protein
MKQRADAASGYLAAVSGLNWADVQARIAAGQQATNADYGDYDYLYFGKGYWLGPGPTQNWGCWQAFLRFSLAALHYNEAVLEGALRFYLAEDASDTNFTVEVRMLAATYADLDPADWGAAGPGTTKSSAGVVTPATGAKYFEIPLTAEMIAALTAGGTADFLLRTLNETAEPTTREWLKAYAPSYATEGLRPYLYLKTNVQRELLIQALFDTLSEIDEFAGYSTTLKTVSRRWLPEDTLNESHFPVAMYSEDGDERDWQVSKTDVGTIGVEIGVGVYSLNQAELLADLNRLVQDVERCIDLNRRLGLEDTYANIIHFAAISKVEASEDYLLAEHAALAFVTVSIQYPRRHRRA